MIPWTVGQFALYIILPCDLSIDQSPKPAVSYSLAKGGHDTQVVGVELTLHEKVQERNYILYELQYFIFGKFLSVKIEFILVIFGQFKFGQKEIKIQKNCCKAPTIVTPVLIFIFFYHHTIPNLSSVSSAET